MLKSIFRLLGARGATPSVRTPAAGPVPAAPAKPVQAGIPIYPPVDNGISYGNAEAVLATQSEMIRRLKLLAGLPATDFERLYGGVLRSLAKHIDLLPASESGTHMGAGGLFRLALELGFFSRQACEAVLFAGRAGVELRAVQSGFDPADWKPMTTVGEGVREIRIREPSGAYRIIYLATLADRVLVLHAFQKKTRATAQRDIDLASRRLRSWKTRN